MNPKVDKFLSKAKQWQDEMEKLRTILLQCGLTEELKWGKPCYAFENSNIVVIQGFKEYCALLFFKGMLLNDPEGILTKTGENTRVGRQIRFTDTKEILKLKPVLKSYIYQAIELEKAGMKVPPRNPAELKVAEELQQKFDESPAFKTAFAALTPGRQRTYHFHFSTPAQSKTRQSRIEKCMPKILKGKGLNEG